MNHAAAVLVSPRGHAVLLLTALLAGVMPGTAQEQVQQRGDIVARLRVQADSPPAPVDGIAEVSLSRELTVTLFIDTPAGVEVGPVPWLTTSRTWRQHNQVKGWETTTLEDGRVRRRQTYRLRPWQPGDVTLPVAPVQFRRNRDQEWEEISWKPIRVRVTTRIQDADWRSARGITGMEELPAREHGMGWWIIMLAGVVLVCLTVLVLFVRRAWSRPQAAVPADEWALPELVRLEKLSLHQAADVEHFHTRLAEIVRRYLELRFGLHAPQQTTAEFLETAHQSPDLTAAQQALLGALLAQCDLAKFARCQPSPEECAAAAAQARTFVEETRVLRSEASA